MSECDAGLPDDPRRSAAIDAALQGERVRRLPREIPLDELRALRDAQTDLSSAKRRDGSTGRPITPLMRRENAP